MIGDILAIVVHAISGLYPVPVFCFLMRTPTVLCVLPAGFMQLLATNLRFSK